MKKVLLMIGAAALMAACSEAPSAPTARSKPLSPTVRPSNDLTCRSGYIVAYDENGNPYCQEQTQTTSSVRARP